MATADVILSLPVAPVIEGVTLTLDFDEALALNVVLRRISGHPDKSRRGKVHAVWNALHSSLTDAGVLGLNYEPSDVMGYITFLDTP